MPVGGEAPVSVQSMTTTVTADVDATLQQIAELTTTAGCQIVRVAVSSQDDADALATIARKSPIPVIAGIHFQSRYVFAAIDAGCAAVRVNPGNIKAFDDKVEQIALAAEASKTPICIRVNAALLDRRLLAKYGAATPAALTGSALWDCALFEDHGFTDIEIFVKHHDPITVISAPVKRVRSISEWLPATAKDKSSSKARWLRPRLNRRLLKPWWNKRCNWRLNEANLYE